MKILVTYKSKTGFTKRYAETIAKKTNADVADLASVTAETMQKYDAVVFGGGLYAGKIFGLEQAKEMVRQSGVKEFVLFATGAAPNNSTAIIEKEWQINLSGEELAVIPHFYMQSGMCYEKMPAEDKEILEKHGSKNKERTSYDISSDEYTEELVGCLLEKSCNK